MKLSSGRGRKIEPRAKPRFFAVLVIFAIVEVREPETHKRLMLVATISILGTAVARWSRSSPSRSRPADGRTACLRGTGPVAGGARDTKIK